MRTLVVQASWSYDRMVGLGVAYAMEPLLRDLPGGRAEGRYAGALSRVAGFFNAHPYFTGLAVGALARSEHDGVPEGQVDRLRNALIGPLGSVGDQVIWAGWLPLSLGVGLVVTATASPTAGVVTFLGLYNAVHLVLRTWGLSAGWRLGPRVAGALGEPVLQFALRFGTRAAVFALGLALPLAGAWLLRGFGSHERVLALGVAVLGLAGTQLLLPALSGVRLGLVFVGAGLVLGLLWR
jgi:PTS system mannose-specific IID component